MFFFFFKQKTAYERRISDWSSDVCSSDLRVQAGMLVVAVGHHRAEVLSHQLRMVLHRLGDRAEDDADFLEVLPEGGGDRDAVEHGVDRDAGQQLLLAQRNAELDRKSTRLNSSH